MTRTIINQPIYVTAVRFNNHFEPVPRRIEYQGRTLNFIGSAIRYCIKRDGQTTRMLDMSDGEAWYRLRRNGSTNNWTLVAITQ